MAEVTVRTADIQLRTCKLTRALLKQFRKLDRVPVEFTTSNLPPEREKLRQELSAKKWSELTDEDQAILDELNTQVRKEPYLRLNKDCCIGWVHASTLGEEHGALLIFVKDGDAYVYETHEVRLRKQVKQLYIG